MIRAKNIYPAVKVKRETLPSPPLCGPLPHSEGFTQVGYHDPDGLPGGRLSRGLCDYA